MYSSYTMFLLFICFYWLKEKDHRHRLLARRELEVKTPPEQVKLGSAEIRSNSTMTMQRDFDP